MTDDWERFNPLTHMVETKDGTKIAVEIITSVTCLWDYIEIARMRAKQREEMTKEKQNDQ